MFSPHCCRTGALGTRSRHRVVALWPRGHGGASMVVVAQQLWARMDFIRWRQCTHVVVVVRWPQTGVIIVQVF